MLALDTETALIAPGLLAPPLTCISLANAAGDTLLHRLDWNPNILDQSLVGHNIAYDMGVLAAEYPECVPAIWKAYDENRITDTQLREQLTHIAAGCYRMEYLEDGSARPIGYHLSNLAERHLGKVLDKDTWRLRYGELRDLPLTFWPEGARDYATTDARVTYDIWAAQEQNAAYLDDQWRQARAAWWLHLASAWGMQVDQGRVDKLEVAWREEYARVGAECQASGLVRKDGSRDMAAIRDRVRAAYAGRELPLTDGENVRTDAQTLRDSGDPTLTLLAGYAGLGKKLGTDIPILREGLIQSRYVSLVNSGRTSSTKPNVQNWARKGGQRECIIPRPGMVFVIADYSMAELHSWAQQCLDLGIGSHMAEVLNGGRDPHAELALDLHDGKVTDEEFKQLRGAAKVANFGCPTGMGAKTFREHALISWGIRLTEEEATRAVRGWKAKWPESKAYFEAVGRYHEGGGVPQMRSRRFRGGTSFTETANTLFQGLTADFTKAAGYEISKQCYLGGGPLLGSRIIAFIHDEYLVEVPEEGAHECAMEIKRIAECAANVWTPDVPNRVDPVVSRVWSKKAEQKWSAGRLVPWEP